MPVKLQDAEAVAEFLEYLAQLIRRGQISAFNAMMTEDGSGRVSLEFPPGVDVPAILRQDDDPDPFADEPTQPAVLVPIRRRDDDD